MQEEHFDGLVGPVQEVKEVTVLKEDIMKALADEDVQCVKVFKVPSQAQRDAIKAWDDMTPNQKRTMRRRLKTRSGGKE